MSAYVGKDGGVHYPNSTGHALITFIDSWTLNLSLENADVTAYGDSAHKRVATLRDWTVDLAGTLDRSDTAQAALLAQLENATLADVSLQLYGTTSRAGKYWSGSGVVGSVSVGSKVTDKVAVSFSVAADGAITWNT